jgi:hypothetical protein
MTVQELINELEEYPMDIQVIVDDGSHITLDITELEPCSGMCKINVAEP